MENIVFIVIIPYNVKLEKNQLEKKCYLGDNCSLLHIQVY